MPRYRKLHTKIVESFDVNDMPDDFTRLTWVLLPLALCREGRGVANASWLKSKLYPLRDDVTIVMIGQALAHFRERGMIINYGVNGRGYFYVPSFRKYQGNITTEQLSDYPPPPGYTPPAKSLNLSWWAKLRQKIFRRDRHTCRYCGAEAEHVDHVIPRVQGGDNEPENLVASCAPCNLHKGGRTPEQAGMRLTNG